MEKKSRPGRIRQDRRGHQQIHLETDRVAIATGSLHLSGPTLLLDRLHCSGRRDGISLAAVAGSLHSHDLHASGHGIADLYFVSKDFLSVLSGP